MRQLRFPGVGPGRQPIGTNVRGGIRQLLYQRRSRKVVEAVVIFVGVGTQSPSRAPVRQKKRLDNAVRVQASFEGEVRWIADKKSVVRAQREKRAVTVDQHGVEAVVHPALPSHLAVIILRGVEGIVRFSRIVREEGGVELSLLPTAISQVVGQLRAVHADLPGEQSGAI